MRTTGKSFHWKNALTEINKDQVPEQKQVNLIAALLQFQPTLRGFISEDISSEPEVNAADAGIRIFLFV
ncbi:UNVERIFIED_CONTAM: hypothetical protein PYX00_002751 [Menopon gallinae]|uniref:Uncharacterized protein n=1 Tax=Menopon gallinae TaxID=328185 RepID=A0AAW2HXY1_9NEOP